MPRFSLLKLMFSLAVVLTVAGFASPSAVAQGDEVVSEEASPPPDQVEEPQYGLLQVSAVSCTGGEAGAVQILMAVEYVPPGECIDGASALLIDGIDYGPVAPYLEVQLEAGIHTLVEPNSGAARDVEVLPGGAAPVVMVTFSAPIEPTATVTVEAAAETPSSAITVVAHSCKPEIQSVDQLYGLGGITDRLNACPAFTLPGYPSPGGTVSGGELSFDFTLSPATGDAQTLTGNGSFVPDAFCESEVGALDNDPTNDRCVSNSGFSFSIPEGAITLTQTYVPDTMRYVAAETGSDADASVIVSSDPGSGYLGLDTSLRGTDQPVVHLFYLNPPRVNVVVHLCDPSITTVEQFQALGGLGAQLLACPASARSYEGGVADFGVTVTDANWGARTLDSAFFESSSTCEADIGDWNGNGGDNECVAAPTYRFDQTAQGSVSVVQDTPPAGYTFAGAATNDGSTVAGIDLASGYVSLDTSYNGDVTVHLFSVVAAPVPTETPTPLPTATKTPVPPTATRTPIPPTSTTQPTRTPTIPALTVTALPSSTPTDIPSETPVSPSPTSESSGETGIVTVAALYCLTSSSGTTIVALPPGQSASASDMGGSSCFAGDASVQITLFGQNSEGAFKLGRDGVESISGIPTTSSSSGSHLLTEMLSGQTASFDVAPGTVTRVIIRFEASQGVVDEGVSSTGGTASGAPGSTVSSGGLVTDELIGDDGLLLPGSFDGISFTTTLAVDDLDTQAVASVKDATSLPGVGVLPLNPAQRSLALSALVALLLSGLGFATRRTLRPGRI